MASDPTRSPGGGRRAAVVSFVALLVASLVPVASAQVPVADAEFGGYATGTAIHADLLQSGDTRAENTEVAFSGSSIDSGGLSEEIQNELRRIVQPALPDKETYGRGSGLEVGFGVTPEDENQVIIAGKAEASAEPPPEDTATEEVGPLDGDPLAYGTLLRGHAEARWDPGQCIIGEDLSQGRGFAADAQLVDQDGSDGGDEGLEQPLLGAHAEDPERQASTSLSHNFLVAQQNGSGFGLASEVRETIAPVTFFEGTENAFTIEFLGEWVLRATTTGLDGGATIHYGPGEVSPETPILRTIDADGSVTNVVTTQDLFGDEGQVIEIPGLAEIVLGEDPRAIGGDETTEPTTSADGTSASAAVDVARVKLLEQTDEAGDVTQRAAQVRIGHMEVAAQVPQGGIDCGIPVDKTADPQQVQVGETFVTPITVTNPFATCDLTNVRIVDEITTEQGSAFTLLSTDPTAAQVPEGEDRTEGTIVWEGLGPIAPGESLTVTATFEADAAGRILDTATATATTADCRDEGAALEGVAEGSEVAGTSPELVVEVSEVLGEQQQQALPRTGPTSVATTLGGLSLLGLAGLGLRLRRRLR